MNSPAGLRPIAALAGLALGLALVPAHAHVIQALRDYDGTDPSVLPALISATGLYDNAASPARVVSAGIKAYDVNTPLWSDGAAKQRYVDLPSGTKITPTDSDHYSVPDKTVFIKNFMIDTVYGDSATRILIETRFLVVRNDPANPGQKQYLGMSYMWHRDQRNAELVDPGAELDTIQEVMLHGKRVGKRWTYPSGADCRQCHQGRGILGFITPQLNRPDAANPAMNQLKALFTAGILSADISKPNLHRWIGLKDTGAVATPEAKSRSYLAANCSHCHGNNVILDGAAHDFDYFTAAMPFRYPAAAGGYVGKPSGKFPGYPQIVYPGYPESSFVMLRIQARGDLYMRSLAQMPPLATFQMDSVAAGVLENWICSLGTKAKPCSEPAVQDDASYWEQLATALFPHAGARAQVTHGLPYRGPWLDKGVMRLPGLAPGRAESFTSDGKAISGRK